MKYIACIGNFDGVHKGHQQLIKKCKELAQDKYLTAAITFDPDPATIYGKDPFRKSLTTLEEKEELLYSYGIDEVLIIPFNKDISLITKDKFIEFFLNQFDLDTLICGPDFSFGHRGEGNTKTLLNSSIKNFKVEVIDDLKYNDEKISSTMIRELIKKDEIDLANFLLGYEYRPTVKVKNKKISSENVLPETQEYKIVIKGEEATVNKDRIDFNDCAKTRIRFI